VEGVVEINNPEYPQALKEIKEPPQRLYYKGDWNDTLFEKCLTVVGSRKMTCYGRQITEKLVSEIARAGITIVSGFMYGIDATAHRAALGAGGRTIAVMPCGINLIHPKYQESLYKEILENKGLIISEFENTHPPALWTYPKRNRIMAGLSTAILVVEASAKSGSLITAELARRYERRVFAVPGPLTSTVSEGTLQLIREGADMVTSAQDVLQCYGLTVSHRVGGTGAGGADLSRLEQTILEKLQQEPLEIDILCRLTEVSASEMGTALSLMQLKGLLFKEEGKYYVK